MINLDTLNIKSSCEKKASTFGWLIALLIFATVIIIYASAIKVTLVKNDGLFQYRAWNWVEYILGVCALVVIGIKYKHIRLRSVVCGLVFALLCWASFFCRTREISTTLVDGIIIFLAYVSGCLLGNQENGVRSSANEGGFTDMGRSVLYGIAVSIPFAFINVAYFVNAQGSICLQNPLKAGFLALQPGIGEEIVFRFFFH